MKASRYLVLAAALLLSSCSGIYSGITGQPIATEPVTTKDNATLNVASADILRARTSPPDTAWGLYDAGLVARRTAEVIKSGK